jgi:hypothetical protein
VQRLIHLIYISSATSWPSENDLQELLELAQKRNLSKAITGMLLYDNATYMQVLEGSEEDVHDIYKSIRKDPRNNGHVLLVQEKISQRAFPKWSMGFENLKDLSSANHPGFQDIFNRKLDKEIAVQNTTDSISLLMGFAKMSSKGCHAGAD